MLDSLMDMIYEATYKNDKPIFEALVSAWRQGHRADNPLERELLRGQYKSAITPAIIGSSKAEIVYAAMAHMIRAVCPEVGEEKINDGNI